MDDFSWGTTRIVIGEKGDHKVLAMEDEGFDPRSIPLQRWDDYATANNLPGRRGQALANPSEKAYGYEDGYEMDDMRSMYSASVHPASTVLTGFKSHGQNIYMPPQSPMPYMHQRPDMIQRGSNYSDFAHYQDNPNPMQYPAQNGSRLMSLGQMSDAAFQHQHMAARTSPYNGASPYGAHSPMPWQSSDNLMAGTPSPPMNRAGRQSPMQLAPQGAFQSRPGSTVPDFQSHMSGQNGPSDALIVETIQNVLGQVDLDTVTKKQVRALVEQRLQMQLTVQRREWMDGMIDVELANM